MSGKPIVDVMCPDCGEPHSVAINVPCEWERLVDCRDCEKTFKVTCELVADTNLVSE